MRSMKKHVDADKDKEELQRQPPSKMTKNYKGILREYNFLKIVKSIEELDECRFKNNCIIVDSDRLEIFRSLTMPCYRKRKRGKLCDFELMAMRSADLDSGEINVYSHSQHNHPLVPEIKRLSNKNEKELMPEENPPSNFRTPDKIEWTFFQTCSDYDKMNEIRCKNHCSTSHYDEKRRRIRFYCNCKSRDCKFILLAMKTTKQGYHLYTNGECNHYPAHKPIKIKTTIEGYHVYKHGENNNHIAIKAIEEKEYDVGKEEIDEKQWKMNRRNHVMEEDETQQFDAADGRQQNMDQQNQIEEEEQEQENENELLEHEEEGEQSAEEEIEEDEEESGEEEEDVDGLIDEEQHQEDKAIEGGFGEVFNQEEEDDDDIIVIEYEEQREERDEGREGSMEIEIIENPRKETPQEKLEKANRKVYKWMAGIGPNEIGGTIGDWDKLSLLKMVEMADQEIREHPQKLNLWLPWLKCAIPKCAPHIDGFNVRFKNVIKLTYLQKE